MSSATLRGLVSQGESMNQGQFVFSQLMQHLPLTTLRRCGKLGSPHRVCPSFGYYGWVKRLGVEEVTA